MPAEVWKQEMGAGEASTGLKRGFAPWTEKDPEGQRTSQVQKQQPVEMT